MKYLVAILMMLVFASEAQAQQQTSPTEQAIGNKLLQEINNGIACNANLLVVQKQLADAQAKIKEIEPKAAPAQPEKK